MDGPRYLSNKPLLLLLLLLLCSEIVVHRIEYKLISNGRLDTDKVIPLRKYMKGNKNLLVSTE